MVSAVVFFPSATWLVVDIVRLRRALAMEEGDDRHDRVFGSIIGVIMAAIGVAGVLKFHLG
ncbi:MAG: hypothetical protein MJE77_06120 [Proteobacteria bacterium]|nr:hypothetical protein [Pseudomonadota bacterium]